MSFFFFCTSMISIKFLGIKNDPTGTLQTINTTAMSDYVAVCRVLHSNVIIKNPHARAHTHTHVNIFVSRIRPFENFVCAVLPLPVSNKKRERAKEWDLLLISLVYLHMRRKLLLLMHAILLLLFCCCCCMCCVCLMAGRCFFILLWLEEVNFSRSLCFDFFCVKSFFFSFCEILS